MVLRILGEVVVGVMAAGIVMALAVPTTMQFGIEPPPWFAWVAAAGSIAAAIVIGERLNKRRKTRESP